MNRACHVAAPRWSGAGALLNKLSGVGDTAQGYQALYSNSRGTNNTASGREALYSNTTGRNNTADGFQALYANTTGSNNLALGYQAGANLTTGHSNICIGHPGVAAEANTIRVGTAQTRTFIAGISGVTSAGGVAVFVNASGQLGTVTSSARFKDDIQDMADASAALYSLRPVTFHYKPELDSARLPQFGLVAEEVEKVNPDLVVRDEQGRVYTVRYEAVNAMLLNEFLKQHRRIETQSAELASQAAQLATLKQQVADMQTLAARLSSLEARRQPQDSNK